MSERVITGVELFLDPQRAVFTIPPGADFPPLALGEWLRSWLPELTYAVGNECRLHITVAEIGPRGRRS